MADKARGKGFKAGLLHGLPIGMGYLSVSFSFGVLAISLGLNWWQAVLISITNLTSAGQVAGLGIMTSAGGLIEMAVSQLVINIRYSLMSISLSQKADSSMNLPSRMLLSFGITDEIFGVASGSGESFSRRYFTGLIVLPVIGWTLGTFLGAVIGSVLPQILIDSFSICIYGMFIAIVLPVCRKDRRIALVSALAISFSVLFYYVGFFDFLSGGFASVLSAVIAALIGAIFLPSSKKEADQDAG
ncbi:MAG: AzlC family ABC transporter permease [Clostridiales bacterium]|nr:AzlC family ABC transporter permease [Clostridiales bacterium]